MNVNPQDGDFSAREAALAEKLREWDPARREKPPSEAEQLWFKERLLAEARAEVKVGSASISGWVRFAAVAGALLLVTASIVLLRQESSPSESQPVRQATTAPVSTSEPPAPVAESDAESVPPVEEPSAAPVPTVVAQLIPEADTSPLSPAAPPEVAPPSDARTEPASSVPAPQAPRQLQMRGASGTRLLWTLDPDFELGEAGE